MQNQSLSSSRQRFKGPEDFKAKVKMLEERFEIRINKLLYD